MPISPTNVTYSKGANVETTSLNDGTEESIMDRLGGIIENLYNEAKDNFEALLVCPGGQRRGWKILDGDSIVEFAPCGCYDDALWPLILGIPAAASAGSKFAAKILAKKARKKWSKQAMQYFRSKIDELAISYGDGLKLLYNIGVIRRKLPPVKPGFKRLYRGQGSRRLQQKARQNIDLDAPDVVRDPNEVPIFNRPDGKYWSDDIGYASSFSTPSATSIDYTNASEVFYIDIPIEEYNRISLGFNRGNGTVSDLNMLPGQKFLTEAGATFDNSVQEFVFPPSARMPLRRRLPDGTITIVEDVPNSKIDLDLNPGIFAWDEKSAQNEFYLDSSLFNTNYIEQITTEANLVKESSTQAFLKLKEKTNIVRSKYDELDTLLKRDPAPSTSEIQQFISQLEQSASSLSSEIDRIFDVYSFEYTANDAVPFLRQMATQTFAAIDYLKYFLPWFFGLLAFIERVMSLVSIVKDKSCIPLVEGGLSEFSNKPRMTQIRNQRIEKKASVWAELNPQSCECSECPPDWNFCDHSSITNLWLKETNSCIPPCCGGQEIKPITLVEICKCDCPPGQVFMPCECSDCYQSDSLLTSIFNPSKPGLCVDANPNPEKLEWNSKSCSWECKDYVIEQPPLAWGGFVKKPLPPCPENGVRQPSSCDCSGSYSISDCDPKDFSIHSFRVMTSSSIKLI